MNLINNQALILERFEVGPFLVNAYILACARTKICVIVDPGDEGDRILNRCRELNLSVTHIVNTHGHADHILDNGFIKQETGAPIIIHPDDAPMLTDPYHNLSAYFSQPRTSPPADQYFQEGTPFHVGELEFDVLHTPGHSPGSVCLVNDVIAIVGDVLFYDSVGRSDFPGGSHETLIRSIKHKLLPRGDHIRAFPGHGPDTTLGRERRENPFLQSDFGY
jgi:glyoxylase-like metal-dependent hydrolase (beta-lactamase superfamily II)